MTRSRVMSRTAGGMLAVSLLWSGGVLAAGPDDGEWYVSPLVSFVVPDNRRVADDGFRAGQFGAGYALDDRWMVEGNLLYNKLTGPRRSIQRGLNLDFIHRWGSDWALTPYHSLGVGWLRTSPDETLQDRRSGPSFSVGVGLLMDAAPGLTLRADYRIRTDTTSPTLTDQVISLGVVFPLGAP